MENLIKIRDYNSNLLFSDLKKMIKKYNIIEHNIIGKSLLGKNIHCVKLGKGKKEVFYCASFHANEWITSLILMKFIEDYCYAINKKKTIKGVDISKIYKTTSIYIVPMVNPDGVDLVNGFIEKNSDVYRNVLKISRRYAKIPFTSGWKANIRGVDFKNYQLIYKVL